MKSRTNIAEFFLGVAVPAGAFFMVYLIKASPDCMDNSYHANRCEATYDYKNYHYVQCDCPCERYARSLERGTCRRCLHYHIPRDTKIKVDKSAYINTRKQKKTQGDF